MVTGPVGKFDPGSCRGDCGRVSHHCHREGFTTLRLSFQAYNEEADMKIIDAAEVLAHPQ